MSGNDVQNVEGVALVVLVAGFCLWYLTRALRRSRPEFHIALPLAVAFGLRLAAIAGIGLTGLGSVLRGGDETTFSHLARDLAAQPLGHGWLPHGVYQLQTVVFAIQLKLGSLTIGALRITQVGIALAGVVLILAAVYDLAGSRAARLAAWLIAFEPTGVFFNSAIHKDPNMELATGLVVFGGTMLWKRLDLRGLFLFALGGAIAVETRAYAGWFLVSAAVFILLHASLRNLDRPLRAMSVVYGILITAFLVTPTLIAISSNKSLQKLQASQTANAHGIGRGVNTDNLKLEVVDFSSRGKILANLPKRIRDLVVRPYPWQVGDASQRFGAIGTLVAYALLALLLFYCWQGRGEVFSRAGPVLYPMLFLLAAYSLAVGNAGTGFRYRTHLVTLAIAAIAILREQAALARARKALWRQRAAKRAVTEGPTDLTHPVATYDRRDAPSLCDLPPWAVKRGGQLPMPLEPSVLNSVVRISTAGDLQGTGFIVGVPSEAINGKVWPYLVTAHHVIRGQIEIAIEVPDPLTDVELQPPVQVEDWSQPFSGVDLAIAPFPFDEVERYQAFPTTHFVPEGTVVPLGSQIHYLGMFAPLDVPMGRAGTLGALEVPVTTKEGYAYHAHLVDCRSYGGFSGSPCLSTLTYVIWDSHATDLPPRALPPHVELGTTATIARFCGMFTAHYDDENEENAISRYGVGVMLSSDCILEALMTDAMKEERRVADQQHIAERDAAQPELNQASVEPASDEWANFEDLTRRLIKVVPKKELDHKRGK